MTLAVEPDEAFNPVQISLFGTQAVMLHTNLVPDPVEQAESTRAVDLLQRDFKGGADVPVLIVFERNAGLTDADLNAIGRLGNRPAGR